MEGAAICWVGRGWVISGILGVGLVDGNCSLLEVDLGELVVDELLVWRS